MSTGKLLKIGDTAGLLGVTTQTLRNWTNSGYMKAIIGKGGILDLESAKWKG